MRTTTPRSNRPGAACGFTLVELLLVMALLAIVMAVAMPSLSAFFRGRSLDYEGRRLLALARHAQTRAVSEGIPMLLWIDQEERTYGLEQEPGWDDRDPKAIEFKLDPELEVEVVLTNAPANLLQEMRFQTQLRATELSESQRRNLPQIRFLPDGSVEETSPVEVRLKGKNDASLILSQTSNRLTYELRPADR